MGGRNAEGNFLTFLFGTVFTLLVHFSDIVQASCLRLRQRDVIKRILVNIQRGSKRLVRSRHNVASSSARSKTANGDAIHGRFKLKSRKQYCPTLYRLLLRKQSFCTQVTPHQIRPTETENDRAKSSSSALRERQRSSDSGRRAAGGEGPNKRTNGQVIKRERERERGKEGGRQTRSLRNRGRRSESRRGRHFDAKKGERKSRLR